MKFYCYEKGRFSHAEEGGGEHNKFWASFYTIV